MVSFRSWHCPWLLCHNSANLMGNRLLCRFAISTTRVFHVTLNFPGNLSIHFLPKMFKIFNAKISRKRLFTTVSSILFVIIFTVHYLLPKYKEKRTEAKIVFLTRKIEKAKKFQLEQAQLRAEQVTINVTSSRLIRRVYNDLLLPVCLWVMGS